MTLKEQIKEQYSDYILSTILGRDKSKKGYICPICSSGTGAKGTGLTEDKKNPHTYTCFRCNEFRNSDVFDIIGNKFGIDNFQEQLKKACEIAPISYTESEYKAQNTKKNNSSVKAIKEIEKDYTEDYKTWSNALESFLGMDSSFRGISIDTLKQFNIGYCKTWKHPNSTSTNYSERIIIPVNKSSYVARDVELNSENRYLKVGNSSIFNAEDLKKTDRPVFIVEGEFDCLSLKDKGFNCIALGSTSNIEQFLKKNYALLETKPQLILLLDNDEPGYRATENLEFNLKSDYGTDVFNATELVLKDVKDPNELLQNNSIEFENRLSKAEEKAIEFFNREKEQAKRDYIELNNAKAHIDILLKEVKQAETEEKIQTGFTDIDNYIDGGFKSGLYTIGAVSGSGKTTMLLQIVDHIARHTEKDILYFTFEMSSSELIAKSLSRLTYVLADKDKNGNTHDSLTSIQILNNKKYDIKTQDYVSFTSEERKVLNHAIDVYKGYSDKIYFIESEIMKGLTAQDIKEKVEEHIRITGKTPIVFIDYLQIIKPLDIKATDKQNMDNTVTMLKQLSRNQNTPVIVISSFNRQSYSANSLDLSALKESGAIEYSSDVVIFIDHNLSDNEKEEEKNYNAKYDKYTESNPNYEFLEHIAIKKNRWGRTTKEPIKVYSNLAYNCFNTPSEDVVDYMDYLNEDNWLDEI